MAITFGQAMTGGNNGVTSATDQDPDLSWTGATAGDVCIIVTNQVTGSNTASTPAGWTLVSGPDTISTTWRSYVYKHTITTDTTSTVDPAFSGSGRTVAAGFILTGADASTLTLSASSPVTGSGGQTTITPDPITTTVANEWVILIPVLRIASGTPSTFSLSGYTAVGQNKLNTAGANNTAGILYLTGGKATAGTETPGAITFTTSSPVGVYTLRIQPTGGTTYQGDASTALSFGTTADVSKTTLGQTSTGLALGLTADTTRTTLGQSSTALSLGLTADTTRTTLGQAATPLTLGVTAAVSRTTLGQTATPLALGLTADTTRTTLAQASTALSFGFTASATVAAAGISADAASTFTLGLTADVSKVTLGQSTTVLTLGFTADGTRVTLGQTSTVLSLGLTAAATKTSLAQASTPLTLGLTAALSRSTLAQTLTPLALAFTASASVISGGITPGSSTIQPGPSQSSVLKPGLNRAGIGDGPTTLSVLAPGAGSSSTLGG